MDLLDIHAKNLKIHVRKYGRPVVLTEPDGTTQHTGLKAIWNDVEHALKFDGLTEDPMGAKSSVYFDTDTLFTRGIAPKKGWKATGSPNAYEPDQDFYMEIPKIDRQLPGQLFFISKSNGPNTGWDKVGT